VSHSYSVQSAKYNATEGAGNPKIIVIGTVDGIQYPFSVTWHQVQSSHSIGGSDAVKLVLAALMLNSMIIYRKIPVEPQQEIPVYYGDVPVPQGPDATLGWVTVPQALCGSWNA
jgi:hypothetical protein